MQIEPKVAIVILNWNGYADTEECIRSLQKIDYPNYQIILVDNGSTDGSAERLKQAFSNVIFIENKENLGFVGGNNIGIQQALARGNEYVLLLNNDTVVDPGFLKLMIKTAVGENRAGIVGPKIYFYDSRVIWFAGGKYNNLTGFTYHIGEDEEDRGQYDNKQEVDFISGCALLAKAEVFKKIGMLDQDFFNSHEDAEFCLRAKDAGFGCVYEPGAIVYHKLARALGGRRSAIYLYYRTRNHLIFKSKRKIKALLFWPKFIYLVIKRILGSLFYGNGKAALATIVGVFDYYRRNWGKGNGDRFR